MGFFIITNSTLQFCGAFVSQNPQLPHGMVERR